MKPLTIALIGVGVLGAAAAAIYLIKTSSEAQKTNTPDVRAFTQDDITQAQTNLQTAIDRGLVDLTPKELDPLRHTQFQNYKQAILNAQVQ